MDHISKAVQDDVAGDVMCPANALSKDWIDELIAMTRPGVEINLAIRPLRDRIMPFAFDDFS